MSKRQQLSFWRLHFLLVYEYTFQCFRRSESKTEDQSNTDTTSWKEHSEFNNQAINTVRLHTVAQENDDQPLQAAQFEQENDDSQNEDSLPQNISLMIRL